MTSKKRLIYVTGVVSVLAVLGAITATCFFENQFWMNFSFAVFGSSLLGFIMSLVEYFVEKKAVLEQLYHAVMNEIKIISNAEYLIPKYPIELIKAYYLEEHSNPPKRFSFNDAAMPARDNLFRHMRGIWESTIDIPEPEFSEYAKNRFKDEIAEYTKMINKVMESYIKIAEQDISNINNAYGQLDFLITNKSMRKNIYLKIYSPITQYKKYIDEKAFHFRNYFQSGDGNIAVMIDYIENIQAEYFKIADESTENCLDILIYRKFIDDMRDNVEWLRSKMYNTEYSPSTSKPFMQYTMRLKSSFPNILIKAKQ